MKRISTVGVLAAFLLAANGLFSWATAAPLVVDTFDHPNPWQTFTAPTAAGPLQSNVVHGTILGQRDLSIGAPGLTNLGDAIGIGTANFGTYNGVGVLDINSNAASTFQTILNFDSFGTLDVSADLGIGLEILAYNNGSVTTETTVVLTTTSGLLTSTGNTFPNIPPGSMMFLIPFSSFTGAGSLSGVTGIQVIFNANNSAGFDITLDSLQIVPTPEPSSLIVWGSVLAAGWFARRKLRKAKA